MRHARHCVGRDVVTEEVENSVSSRAKSKVSERRTWLPKNSFFNTPPARKFWRMRMEAENEEVIVMNLDYTSHNYFHCSRAYTAYHRDDKRGSVRQEVQFAPEHENSCPSHRQKQNTFLHGNFKYYPRVSDTITQKQTNKWKPSHKQRRQVSGCELSSLLIIHTHCRLQFER